MAETTTPNHSHYSEYVLVNPMITSFAHDTMDYAETGFATHTMGVEYETVLYNAGTLEEKSQGGVADIASWSQVRQRFFDSKYSPLATNVNSTLLGSGGIIDSVESILGQVQSGNFASAALTAARLGVRAQNLRSIALGDINSSVRNALASIQAGKGSGFPI